MADTGAIGNFIPKLSVEGLSAMGTGLLVFALIVILLVGLGLLIFSISIKKKFFIKIRVFRMVGNTPTEVAFFKAREVPMGMAGDKLWRVSVNSVWSMPFKVVKWLPVGKKQTAPNEFWFWIREDGEWINFTLSDLDDKSRQMGVKFVKEDMRLQRLATDRLLEQRLMQKSFWEKYGNTIMTIILFLVVAVCMVIIFYQWGKLLDQMNPLVEKITRSLDIVNNICAGKTEAVGGLVPA